MQTDMMPTLFVRTSILTNVTRERLLNVREEDLIKYDNGALIQVAFPYLTAADREFIKTGITDEEWQELMGANDEANTDDMLYEN